MYSIRTTIAVLKTPLKPKKINYSKTSRKNTINRKISCFKTSKPVKAVNQ